MKKLDSTQKRNLLAIMNPIAGKGQYKKLIPQLHRLAYRANANIDISLTSQAGHATVLAESAAKQGFDGVIGYGGDGTLNEIVNGLGVHGLPLMLVRGGTGNALSREINAPKDPLKYVEALKQWRLFKRDLGITGEGRLFACFAGVGIDGEGVRMLGQYRTGPITMRKYVSFMTKALIKSAHNLRNITFNCTLDGKQHTKIGWVHVAISPLYGSVFRFTPNAIPDDGLFDVLVARDANNIVRTAEGLGLALIKQTQWIRKTNIIHAKTVVLDTLNPADAKMPYQLDGDFCGYLPLKVDIIPGGLTLFRPDEGEV